MEALDRATTANITPRQGSSDKFKSNSSGSGGGSTTAARAAAALSHRATEPQCWGVHSSIQAASRRACKGHFCP